MQEVVRARMEAFGQAGHAKYYDSISLPDMAVHYRDQGHQLTVTWSACSSCDTHFLDRSHVVDDPRALPASLQRLIAAPWEASGNEPDSPAG